ncbi:methyl-accepting chemotaxis protein [Heyndrickxia camelliae]|uniref:Methyl-accepting chemotaxis protein n=1 Tax=Heyndrickxia camelliae TaxID=1707093 RepID=A0A2N3LP20_9BACI|nr:methyl-accepting chemotaxis protein [Heyndrickxia camelliae]PKR86432.1 hypothetical protein CWO92_04875 [Heyndrickxia camelliae]
MKKKKRISFKAKLLVYSLLLSIIPIIIISFFLNSEVRNTTQKSYTESSKKEINQVDNAISLYFDTIHENAKLLATNPLVKGADKSIKSYMTVKGVDSGQSVNMTPSKNGKKEKGIFDVFSNFGASHPNAAYVYMGTADGGYIQYPEGPTTAGFDPRERPWYKTAIENPGKVNMTSAYAANGSDSIIVSNVVTIEENGQQKGVLGLDVDLNGLTGIIKDIKIGKNGYVILAQDDGTILADPKNAKLNFQPISKLNVPELKNLKKDSSIEAKLNGKEYVFTTISSKIKGWNYISVVEKSEFLASAQHITNILLIVGAIIAVLAVLVSFFMSTKITRDIKKLSALSVSMSEGDLTQQVTIKSNDEIGETGENFNKMAQNLKEMITRVADGSQQLSATSEELAASSEENLKASSQIAESIQSVASGTDEQNAEMNNAVDIMKEVLVNVEGVTSSMENVRHSIHQSAETASHGSQVVNQTVQQMAEIDQNVASSAEKINELKEKSNEISQISLMIQSISEQTNLLALNAAIEAARAGEQGKGFAVVADEVRKLAEQSSQSASQISDIITDIQKGINESMEMVDKGSDSTKEGLVLVNKSGAAFQDINDSVRKVTENIAQASGSMEKMKASIEEVFTHFEKVFKTSIGVNEHSQNVAASSEEMSASMNEVSSAAQELAKMALELEEVISQFKL